MHRITGLIVAIALSVGSASAQDAAPNPVMEHYRAYNAALQRGDMAAAETSAAAAVAASEARDGDGGRTGVLLVNLTQVRLTAGHFAEAVEPARRALTLAQQGTAGVDVIDARLLLDRAELGQGGGSAVAQRVQADLAEARAAGGHESQVYLAASALGSWTFTQRRYGDSVAAWTMAVDTTTQGDPSGVIPRANALINRGAAQMFADEIGYRNGRTGTNIRVTPEGRAELDYAEALRILRPLVLQPPRGPALTQVQQLYANALAWSVALRAKLRSLGWEDPAPLQNGGGFMVGLTPGPVCQQQIDQVAEPSYPGSAANNLGVGSVVIRLVTDANGEIVERGVVSYAGGDAFRASVERVLPRWRTALSEQAVQPCTRASVMMMSYLFYIGEGYE